MFCKEVCGIPLMWNSIAIHVQHRIIIGALSPKTDPPVPARHRVVTHIAHMPFPKEPCAIAVRVEIFIKKRGAFGYWALVINHLMVMSILPRQNGSTTG